MTKTELIRAILDSATTGTQAAAEAAIDSYIQEHCIVLNRAVEGIAKQRSILFSKYTKERLLEPTDLVYDFWMDNVYNKK